LGKTITNINRKQMTPLEQIDFVFFYIRDKIQVGGDWGYNNVWNHVEKTTEANINKTLFNEIINKLKEDELITEDIGGPQLTYHVTFKGLIFEGYNLQWSNSQREINELKSLRTSSQSNSEKMTKLTNWVMIGTTIAALYYFLEILNHWFCIYSK